MRKATDVDDTSPELLSILQAHKKELVLPSFNHEIAWELGTLLRARFIKEKVPSGHSAAIQIRAFPEGHLKHASILFATTVGSVPPGIGSLVAGKANVVKWSGTSTYLTRTRFKSAGIDLAEFGLTSPEYFMHGGGFPVRLANHPTPVAVIVVSGMPSQAEDHQLIVDTLVEYLPSLQKV
ncbi:hypothetical protein EHS25_000783 [Saitozyma podzolica]|uniref:DUF967 domain protein n=1 Tax=Saitozyma podzolica TaxID=1890683 RepID=A0A427YX87_9TREE|nr:hypothetical protein EHS25_000783 [Saitozyma podzolica]